MKLLLALTVLSAIAMSGNTSVVGIDPKNAELYQADCNGKWRCLTNPEIELDFNQVNDDYCDCPDGSDEPGTSACSNGVFYCQNKGHIPSYIKASLVNDGVCEYALCCDGSDEWNTPKDCPDRCAEIHDKYQEELEAKEKEYKSGAAKAEITLRAAKKLRNKLQETYETEVKVLEFLNGEIAKNQEDIEKMKNKDETFAQLKTDIESGIKKLRRDIAEQIEVFVIKNQDLTKLNDILKQLNDGFNHNLNDNAVKSTLKSYINHLDKYKDDYVKDFDFEATLKEITKLLKGNFTSVSAQLDLVIEQLKTSINLNEGIEERYNDLENYLKDLIDNYNPNFNDAAVKGAVQSFQDFISNKQNQPALKQTFDTIKEDSENLKSLIARFDPKSDIKATINAFEDRLPILDRLRYKFRSLLNDFLGIHEAPKPEKNGKIKDRFPENEYDDFLNELLTNKKTAQSEIDRVSADLSRDLGPHDILRPLEDISVSGKIGEYDYEVFFQKDIHQKGKNNHDVKIGTYSHYELHDIDEQRQQFRLFYENGARCWNGPLRRGIVTVDCGAENEVISVTEPEKCEYHFRVKAPIGCKVIPKEEAQSNFDDRV